MNLQIIFMKMLLKGMKRMNQRDTAELKRRLNPEKRNPSVSLELCQEQADGSAEIERAFLQQEQKITLYHALSRIRVEYRQVLWLTYFEGFDHRQAAEIMKKTVHSVDTLVYRAKKALKTELEKEGFEYEKF